MSARETFNSATLKPERMALQSTEIVRGHVQRGKPAWHGSQFSRIILCSSATDGKELADRWWMWPCRAACSTDSRQTWAGTPDLVEGHDYILFLWRSRSGLNLIIGLSQGLFVVKQPGEEVVQASTTELPCWIDPAPGVKPAPVRMKVADMRKYVQQVVAEAR